MRIKDLVWNQDNIDHIAEHNVVPGEIEELIFEDEPHFRRGPGENLYHVYGQTEPGRYLFVVIIYLEESRAPVVTAREMEQSERRLYQREVGK